MKKSNKKWAIFLVVVMSVAAIGVALKMMPIGSFGSNNKLNKISFSEIQICNLDFNEGEKNNINQVLSMLYTENEKYAGFANQSSQTIDLYKAEYYLKLADLKSTVFGVLLSTYTDYEINTEKINQYVDQTYKAIDSLESGYEQSQSLYYAIILDQLLNGYEKSYDVTFIQNQIDRILNEMDYEENLMADIV